MNKGIGGEIGRVEFPVDAQLRSDREKYLKNCLSNCPKSPPYCILDL
jgi:hypothetical protein